MFQTNEDPNKRRFINGHNSSCTTGIRGERGFYRGLNSYPTSGKGTMGKIKIRDDP